ncbi:penicillin amidase precursor related protein [Thermoplasma acidophilum]|uniref:Penicillin amidase related protein n=1 Tax=Thermoplasma acidophilum (strain ATCC 25905 / DSM 1728 / JCM 9062 / NBRC 15155 / AMRC-C165) TaxID=273075 RepID=Q9HI83_THEAC|nr:penicillin acylase family protein [Thermoplasma acidophilum]CAC12580.1 penicillin amidase precursor related protein [Thermoplasma acidophilum]
MKIRYARLFVSVILLAILLFAGFSSIGPLPPLIRLANPSSGVFSPPAYFYAPGSQKVQVEFSNVSATVLVYRQADGFIGIASNSTRAVYYEQGYLEAEYRLAQLDFLKRTALGNLSAIAGPSTLQTDIFMRELQLYNTAIMERQNLSADNMTYIYLKSFVLGINAYIGNLTYSKLPLLFKILNVEPHRWNVTDVLAVQQLFLWENSAGGLDPIYFNFALQKMPESVIKAIYPAYPAGVQNPIVPYSLNPKVYDETGDIANLNLNVPYVNLSDSAYATINSFYTSAMSGLAEVSSLFTGSYATDQLSINYTVFHDFGSNDWAVNGIRTSNASAILANDPHLTTSVPSIWMGFQLVSPGMNVIGVTFPGFPGIILGHNPYVAWGATNGQIQETYFYAEQTSPDHPGDYLFNGSWVPFKVENETVLVKGEKPVHIEIEVAKNGVVINDSLGVPVAMDWTGYIPTYEITFFLNIDRSHSVMQFVQNLTEYFKVAIQNWAVADSSGNIGIFPYGLYPVIERGNPRGILPGNGSYDWTGFVPYSDLPYLYDPSRGFVFSANQITVSPNYPYYIGWDYESGYRADQIYTMLNSTYGFNYSKMEKIQLTVHDFTTDIFLKPLVKALNSDGLSDTPEYSALSSWNGNMDINSTAATIYYFFIRDFVSTVFAPWFSYYGINATDGMGQTSFFLGTDDYYHGPLIEDLVNWTMTDQNASFFSNPVTGHKKNETADMLSAYSQAISYLTDKYGQYSSAWEWGNIHKRYLSSFFGISAMNTQEVPAAGDGNTVNAAYGTISDFGPSWRMIVNMSDPASGIGIYPGGISENPLSQYYDNTFIDWNNGVYFTLINTEAPSAFFYLYRAGDSP